MMYKPNHDELAQVWAKYPSWGLRAGDVIEAVHIKEIVDAVDYLIDYGVWSTIGICTRKRTPGQFMGKDCGYHYATNYTDCFGTSGAEWRVGCQKCCANADACWPYDHVLGYWYHQWDPATTISTPSTRTLANRGARRRGRNARRIAGRPSAT